MTTFSQSYSYLRSANAEYIDEVYEQYLKDPDSVDPSWRYFFEGIEVGFEDGHRDGQETALQNALSHGAANGADNGVSNGYGANGAATETSQDTAGEFHVAELILAYREVGHRTAQLSPIKTGFQATTAAASHPLLELSRHQLSDADLARTFKAATLAGFAGPTTLQNIIARLKATYCSTVGVEFMHILDRKEREWLQSRMEATSNHEAVDPTTCRQILKRLSQSEAFEKFLHTRYVAAKRFSIEGGDSVLAGLDCMVETGAALGAQEFVLGMAHRGRLTVLANVFGKKPEYIFTEFEGTYKVDLSEGEGDVKYHIGYSADVKTRAGQSVHLSLAFNPSHLEVVNPVIEGMARAKQATLDDQTRSKVIPIAIHGDAAFAGQGVCYETINMSQLRGYSTGGTLHIVINNQVGFTTGPQDSRSTNYCTDVAKMLDAPIFHVNGDDPEAMWFVSKLCTEYRQKFHKDAFIDLICYRKHGHNEGDEPSFTQPVMYKEIKTHPSPREVYANQLAQSGVVPAAEAQAILDELNAGFAVAQAKAKAEAPHPPISAFEGRWKKFHKPADSDIFAPSGTAVQAETIQAISQQINTMPQGFQLHSKLGRFFEARAKAVQDGKGIDWGNGEALAYATLLKEGFSVRISGQDAERGTFTHRHAVVYDFETGVPHTPLNSLAGGKGQGGDNTRFEVYNSHLSETGVMGFEYGYTLSDPYTLTIWEAQFGDFANGAQIIIDQFLSASESKWRRTSGLVLLLPHGYEGQGPEHSSARFERFLTLCGKQNMYVCNFTTPAQIFHALRRQMHRDFRKPLIVMTPKSLLRLPVAVSSLDDFTKGRFFEVLDDVEASTNDSTANTPRTKITRVLLCTGRVYYELLAERQARKLTDVAIVRVEQLYPWPGDALAEVLGKYPSAQKLIWVQEEPRNMGAWSFVFGTWMGGLDEFASRVDGRRIQYVGREVCASPAVGSPKIHEKEQKALVAKAFEI